MPYTVYKEVIRHEEYAVRREVVRHVEVIHCGAHPRPPPPAPSRVLLGVWGKVFLGLESSRKRGFSTCILHTSYILCMTYYIFHISFLSLDFLHFFYSLPRRWVVAHLAPIFGCP